MERNNCKAEKNCAVEMQLLGSFRLHLLGPGLLNNGDSTAVVAAAGGGPCPRGNKANISIRKMNDRVLLPLVDEFLRPFFFFFGPLSTGAAASLEEEEEGKAVCIGI